MVNQNLSHCLGGVGAEVTPVGDLHQRPTAQKSKKGFQVTHVVIIGAMRVQQPTTSPPESQGPAGCLLMN